MTASLRRSFARRFPSLFVLLLEAEWGIVACIAAGLVLGGALGIIWCKL